MDLNTAGPEEEMVVLDQYLQLFKRLDAQDSAHVHSRQASYPHINRAELREMPRELRPLLMRSLREIDRL